MRRRAASLEGVEALAARVRLARQGTRAVAIALLACAGFAPELARSGEVMIPCQPGSFSSDGLEPCTPCPAGTFAPLAGAFGCGIVSEGTWAPQGSAFPRICECADEPLCTIDRCAAETGECTAHDPAPWCTPYSVRATGVVTDIAFGARVLDVFAIGMPFVATWLVDPAEFDRSPTDVAGTYPNAIRSWRVRVGSGPNAVEAASDFDPVYFESTPPRDGDYLDLIASPTVPAWEFASFALTLDDGDDPTITSDAIPAAFPSPASFASRDLRLGLQNGETTAIAWSDDFVLTTPEPGSTLFGVGSTAAVYGLRRVRGARPGL